MRIILSTFFFLSLISCGGGSSSPTLVTPTQPPIDIPKPVSKLWQDYKLSIENNNYDFKHSNGYGQFLLDYSKVGYKYGTVKAPDFSILSQNSDTIMSSDCSDEGILINGIDIPVYLAECFNIIASDGVDDGLALQNAINIIQASRSGGILFFSKGNYDFRKENTYNNILISSSNIFLVGEIENSRLASIFNLYSPAETSNNLPWGDFFLFKFKSNKSREILTTDLGFQSQLRDFSVNFEQDIIQKIETGSYISTSVYNDNGTSASKYLTYPIEIIPPQWLNYQRKEPFRFVSQVKNIDGNIEMVHSIPLEIPFNPSLYVEYYKEPFISNVGIQNIKFTSNWHGKYCHHGKCGDFSQKEVFDMNYGWAGIQLDGVANGSFKNIEFNNFTLPIEVNNSTAVTASELFFKGHDAHHAIILRGWHNLVSNIYIENNTTHALTTNEFSIGNVFHNVKNRSSGTLSIDFHAKQPALNNLFDSVENAFIDGAGNEQDLPHSGTNNILWNITVDKNLLEQTESQVFYSWISNRESQLKESFKLFPHTVVVNYSSKDGKIFIGENSEDFYDQWIYAEGLNNSEQLLQPESLFCAQLEISKNVNFSTYCKNYSDN